MNETLHALWLEDVWGVRERARDKLWWRAVGWVHGAGMLCAFILWGWPRSVLVAVTIAMAVVFLAVPFAALGGSVPASRLVDHAIVVGLLSTGAVALTVASAPIGLGVALLMAGTSSPGRRRIRSLRCRGPLGRFRQPQAP